MPQPSEMPSPGGRIADAREDNWVDRRAPARWRPYLRLSRADRPIGGWLLLIPCFWGVTLAAVADGPEPFDLWIVIGCTAGAFVMRGAGCTWNDITDRGIDGLVERTRSRPLPSGQVSVPQALVWMAVQALIGLAILLTFNLAAVMVGILSLIPVVIYPFAKRFTWWPQVFLGVAFNWGALLAWTAHRGTLEWPAVVLYMAGIAWTLFYDTIYAHQDSEDDALIGVKSTARLFGERTDIWLRGFAVATVTVMAAAILVLAGNSGPVALAIALLGPCAMAWNLFRQVRQLDIDDPETCLRLFRSNRDAGLIPVPFFVVAAIV